MKKTLTIGAILAAIAAVGAVGVLTSMNIIQEAEAASCNQFDFGFRCHGCFFEDQGYESSEGRCHHHV
jgi:hypothetical protein